MTVEITRAETPEDLRAVRDLIRAVLAWAMAGIAKVAESDNPPASADLEAERAGRPARFGPSSGRLLLARLDATTVGCVVSCGHTATTMEIKRMIVRPEAWGRGVGAQLLKRLVAEAQAARHTRHLLPTHHDLHAARALYRRAGFHALPGSAGFPGIVEGLDICMNRNPDQSAAQESHLA